MTMVLPLFSGRLATSMAAQTLAPEEMPAVNALYAMGRALYPEPSRRDAVRAQWRPKGWAAWGW